MPMTDWITLDSEVAFDRPPYLRVVRETVQVAPGVVIPDFYQVLLRDFAVVVPVLTDGQILTQRMYRHGPRRMCLSFPGGFLDPGETPEQAARREMAEESGLVACRLIALGDFVDNGNQRGCLGHYFIALDCMAGPGRQDHAAEAATDHPMSHPEVEAALDAGAFGVIHHVAAWLLARRWLDQRRHAGDPG